MDRNLAKELLKQGGFIKELIIPSNLTGGTGLCNPSVLIDGESIKLNLRHVEYTLYHAEDSRYLISIWGKLAYLNKENDCRLKTNNYLCELNSDTLEIDSYQLVDMALDQTPIWEFVGLEDARLVKWDNKLYMCGVRRDTTTNGQGRIELSEIVNNKEVSRHRISPPNNEDTYCEKNWMPILDMPFHFIRWANPLQIIKVDLETNTSEIVIEKNDKLKLDRELRGGSNVVSIGDYKLAITHEVDLWFNEVNQKNAIYYHRFMLWDKDWNLTTISGEFSLLGADIEFISGMAVKGTDLLITFGYQDNAAFILNIPIKSVEKYLEVDITLHSEVNTNKTEDLLLNFVNDYRNYNANIELADKYFKEGQFASAFSFYIKAFDYTEIKEKKVDCLLMMGKCLKNQKDREKTELGIYKQALALMPNNAKVYFALSQYYEYKKEWFEAYTYASMGCKFDNYLENNQSLLEFPSGYGLMFQKAVAAWWVGKIDECKTLFKLLSQRADLNARYKDLVETNIRNIFK